MRKRFTVLALVAATGCALAPAGVVLVFPDSMDKSNAALATFYVITPPSATGDLCSQYVAIPELKPDPAAIETMQTVALTNGVASTKLKAFPVGYQTVLVKVFDKSNGYILHGCRTGVIASGKSFNVTLEGLSASTVDMTQIVDAASSDMTAPSDMAMNKVLAITVEELRAPVRKLNAVAITVTDANGMTATAMTDTSGQARINALALTAPLSITAVVAADGNGYLGAATVAGINPTYPATGIAPVTLRIELEPLTMAAANLIAVTPGGAPAATMFNVFWLGSDELAEDFATTNHMTMVTQGSSVNVQPLVAGENYRLAVLEGQTAIATPGPLVGTGGTYTPQVGTDFKPMATALTLTVTTNATYTTQNYAVAVVLPPQLEAPIAGGTFNASGAQAAINVPAMAGMVQLAAFVVTEEVGVATNKRAELRHALAATAPTMDTLAALPNPPTATTTPASPVAAAAPFTITATPPAGLNPTNAFVHVHFYTTAATNLYNYHLMVPAANPTTITVPAGVLPVGTYSVDVSFGINFPPLLDGSVQATLADDYSKLLRPVLQELSLITLTGFMVQ